MAHGSMLNAQRLASPLSFNAQPWKHPPSSAPSRASRKAPPPLLLLRSPLFALPSHSCSSRQLGFVLPNTRLLPRPRPWLPSPPLACLLPWSRSCSPRGRGFVAIVILVPFSIRYSTNSTLQFGLVELVYQTVRPNLTTTASPTLSCSALPSHSLLLLHLTYPATST
ncbi:hypothetical protein BKA65DRAFT_138628 [Rhexocercosporidium sp. MPI-PUGE-AT-0058]|nr:hypothetical protein BKA65DRAFT_138628 [Rhexocercosporidium sp. MPI-PUGE-AT-0058]